MFLNCFLFLLSMQSALVGALLFQPEFKWANHTATQQGTGSFIRTSDGTTVALTSAHFINFSGPKLLEINCLDIQNGNKIATSSRCVGWPGKEGSYTPLDLRSDYLIFAVNEDISMHTALPLDDREIPAINETVWFPNKNRMAQYESVNGIVKESKNTHTIVLLDRPIDLRMRSGTPVISHMTGKVIGILTGGCYQGDKTLLYLTPAFSINKAIKEAENTPYLWQVIGK